MEKENLIDIWDKLESRNHSYWTFFAVTVLAAGGWRLTADGSIHIEERIVMTAGLLVFLVVNFGFVAGTLTGLEKLKAIIEDTTELDPELASIVAGCIGKHRYLGGCLMHAAIDLALLVMIWT